jgi:hypothetical protein
MMTKGLVPARAVLYGIAMMGVLISTFHAGSMPAARTLNSPPPIRSETPPVIDRKIFLLVYDPILSNQQRFHEYENWPSYETLVDGIVNFFQTTSNGQLQFTITPATTHVFDQTSEWPAKVDGFRYTEQEYLSAIDTGQPHTPDDANYDAVIGDPALGICGKLNRGEIDELWIYGGPYDGFDEARLAGPGGYSYVSSPMTATHGCKRLLPIMGLRFDVGLVGAIHAFGHRAEASMSRVYGTWEANRTAHNWDRFALVDSLSNDYVYSGCGTIHYPPNGTKNGDYANSNPLNSNCEDFLNYPELSDPQDVLQPVTCAAWGCTQFGYLTYWFSHLPSAEGCGADAVASNWWPYFADPNLPLTPSSMCPTPACPTITAWKGEYWVNTSLTGPPVLCRDDKPLNFNWGYGSPDVRISTDQFSVRWTRTMYFKTGIYRFHIGHDDGARLFIDNERVSNYWGTCCVWQDVTVRLEAGMHTVRLEMFEGTGAAWAGLWWEQISLEVLSVGSYDGWTLESRESSNHGGSRNVDAATFNVGDDAADRQFRGILSFNTSGLPDNAAITNAVLRVREQGLVGTSPFDTHGSLQVDIRKPYFGGSASLAISDFETGAGMNAAAIVGKTPVNNWYSASLKVPSFVYINRKGTTQLRLRFAKDDNDDRGADFLRFYSGDASAVYRPVLVIRYYIP